MGFSEEERRLMRALRGVGPTVIERLEQVGFSSLTELAGRDPAAINQAIAQMLRATCWTNSPLARSAIAAVINLANERNRHERT